VHNDVQGQGDAKNPSMKQNLKKYQKKAPLLKNNPFPYAYT
jgi:hypothetical protein